MNPTTLSSQPRPVNGMEKLIDAPVETAKLHTMPHLQSRFVHQPLDDNAWSLSEGKRLFDLVAALAGLTFFFPLMILIGILVAVSSPGPVLFRQKRTGRWGALFTIYKFRTMYEAENGPCITVHGDCRITKVGSILRKFKLDELPQFLNVIKGDMSFIGPRPKLPHHESLHMPFRPGITGAATLAFRCEEELLQYVPQQDLELFYARTIKPLKAKLDWEYMQRATWRSDMVLLWCTATACLSSSTAPKPVIEMPQYDHQSM